MYEYTSTKQYHIKEDGFIKSKLLVLNLNKARQRI
jgi:hypothetical protein